MNTEQGSELMQHGVSGGTDYGPAALDVSLVGVVCLLSLCQAGCIGAVPGAPGRALPLSSHFGASWKDLNHIFSWPQPGTPFSFFEALCGAMLSL